MILNRKILLLVIQIFDLIDWENTPVAIWKIGTECLHASRLLPGHLSYIYLTSHFWYISNIYLTHRSLWWRMKTQITLSCNINVMTEIFPWFLPCRQISWDFLLSRKFYISALTQISPGFLPSRQVSGVGALTGRRRPIKLVQGHCFSLFSSKFEVNIFS